MIEDYLIDLDSSLHDLIFCAGSQPMAVGKSGTFDSFHSSLVTESDLQNFANAALTDRQADQLALKGGADFACSFHGYRFRGSLNSGHTGLVLTLRLLPESPRSLHHIGVPDALKAAVQEKHGLVLLAGATGSGKSTTLASLLFDRLAKAPLRLITLEDPIEYVYPNPHGLVQQREIGSHVPSFSDGLRQALRQRPDVILVGELRDAESIKLALTAAETGHLVLSTVHASTPDMAVQRMVDAIPESEARNVAAQLAASLRVVASQQLKRDRKSLVAHFETLVNTTACAQLIRDKKYHQLRNQMLQGSEAGMTLNR